MNTDDPGRRRRTLVRVARRLVVIASVLGTVPAPAHGVDSEPRGRRELVPTGARATIELEAPETADDTVRELRMEKGKSVFARTGYGVSRVSVGNPNIADVLVLRAQELQIVAKAVGTT